MTAKPKKINWPFTVTVAAVIVLGIVAILIIFG
jgi:hypothetical protein